MWLKELSLVFMWPTELNFLLDCDSKNWVFFSKFDKEVNLRLTWLKGLNLLFFMTQRIELFGMWLKELNLFFLKMTQRIEPFFLNVTQRIEFFFSNMTQRIEPFLFWIRLKVLNLDFFWSWLKDLFFKYYLKIFFWIWLKKLTFFLLNVTQK